MNVLLAIAILALAAPGTEDIIKEASEGTENIMKVPDRKEVTTKEPKGTDDRKADVPEQRDTLREAVVSGSLKNHAAGANAVTPVTSLVLSEIEAAGIADQKALSLIVPNLSIPDYGSSMTSSIYMRGFGSRIDNPVMGLYIDDIPVLNKNSYEFPYMDIRRIDVMRGPQGTLYGRNSMAGMIAIETLAPDVYQGARASLEYGSANTVSAGFSLYKGSLGGSVYFRHSDGFFTNEYDGGLCDEYNGLSLRFVAQKKLRSGWNFENVLTSSVLSQGGYPYRRLVSKEDYEAGMESIGSGGSSGIGDGTGTGSGSFPTSGKATEAYGGMLLPVDYNDECSYQRFNLTDGIKLSRSMENWDIASITSLQLLFDKMTLDQDFTRSSMFTLRQIQREYALTQELILKPAAPKGRWDHQNGFFGFIKYNDMSAPVRFKEDGINSLILDNANAGIPDAIGSLDFQEDSFVISSDFGTTTYGLALYHESHLDLGDFKITAGLRLDHENSSMNYESMASLHYILEPLMKDYRAFTCYYSGDLSSSSFTLLPKLAVSFDAASALNASETVNFDIFGSISRGYKAGGFNTQIFSDILQNKMMDDMMADLGVYFDNPSSDVTADNTTYKPETCMDFELGFKSALRSGAHRLSLSATAFMMFCENQQLTVFPDGNSTGRMMTNAGKSESKGIEAELDYRFKGLTLSCSYGFTDARFTEFNDGKQDYSGNRMPYAPESTARVSAGYRFSLGQRSLTALSLMADWSRTGRIAWNESNSLEQAPYSQIGANISLSFKKFELYFRGSNLTDTVFDTFYFRSVSKDFFQRGKPLRLSVGLRAEF